MSWKENVRKWIEWIKHPGKTKRRTSWTRRRARKISTDDPGELERKMAMIAELETAKKEWIIAQKKFEYAVEKDQIDYAIYALEAAEKRYEMLLRSAKRERLSLRNEATGRIMEVR